MALFLLAVTVLSYVIAPVALAADDPEKSASAQPDRANLAPVYVKIIWPDDPATPANEKDRPVIESWITKSIENRNTANFKAVTDWVPLAGEPDETTDLWDENWGVELVKGHPECFGQSDVVERKDGRIKISFDGWTLGMPTIVTLQDEPGSREVVAITPARTKHGVPHIAVFVGLRAK